MLWTVLASWAGRSRVATTAVTDGHGGGPAQRRRSNRCRGLADRPPGSGQRAGCLLARPWQRARQQLLEATVMVSDSVLEALAGLRPDVGSRLVVVPGPAQELPRLEAEEPPDLD